MIHHYQRFPFLHFFVELSYATESSFISSRTLPPISPTIKPSALLPPTYSVIIITLSNKIQWPSKTPGRSKCSPTRTKTKPPHPSLQYLLFLNRTIPPLLHLGSRIIRTIPTILPLRLLLIAGSRTIQLRILPILHLGLRIILMLLPRRNLLR